MPAFPPVAPMYWLAVCRSGEAIDMLCSGQAKAMGWSKFCETFPVVMHPDFPQTIEFGASIVSRPGEPADPQWLALAEWLRRVQATTREKVPKGHVVALFNLGFDLKTEQGGKRRTNLMEAVNSFERAAEIYARLNDQPMLQRTRDEIAEVSAMLTEL